MNLFLHQDKSQMDEELTSCNNNNNNNYYYYSNRNSNSNMSYVVGPYVKRN